MLPLTCGAMPVPAVMCNVVDATMEVTFALELLYDTSFSLTERLVVVCACLVVELLPLDGVLELVFVSDSFSLPPKMPNCGDHWNWPVLSTTICNP